MIALLALLGSRTVLIPAAALGIIASLFLGLQLGKAHGTIKGLNRDIVTLEKNRQQCRAELGKKTDELADAERTIQAREADILEWQGAANRAEKEAQRLANQARKEAAKLRAEQADIENAIVTGDHCTWALNKHQMIILGERGR